MIGLSVSFCILDMVQGRVNPNNVKKIVGRTSAKPEMIDELIRLYRQHYWYDNPDACEQLFRKMLADGKIEQPLLTNGRAPIIEDGRRWVNSEDQITWSDERHVLL